MLISKKVSHSLWLAAGLVFAGAAAGIAEEAPVFDSAKLSEIPVLIEGAIEKGRLPGGVFWLERGGEKYTLVTGDRSLEPEKEEMTLDTIFDVASLTKVIATTSSMAVLIEREDVALDGPVVEYIPEFAAHGKEQVTIRQLLTHTSGLRPGISRPSSYSHAIELACGEKLQSEPGEKFVYSDINFILLGEVVRRVSGKPLEVFAHEEIFEPLGMVDTGFLPPPEKLDRIAPTQRTSSGMLRGVVHDPTSRAMGGVAGHAGLFLTAQDLARFARMMLNGGELDGTRIFAPETVELFTSVQSPETIESRRGLGWDIDSRFSSPRGSLFPIGSYGHTGWTGPSIWIDPYSDTFWLFLNSRVHPDGSGNVVPLRRELATVAAEAVVGFDFANVPEALARRDAAEEGK